jgi:hypothetical protein
LNVSDKKERCGNWTRLFMKTMDRMWRLQQLKEMSERMTAELARLQVEQANLLEELG